MFNGRLLLWTLIAWPLPALIAGALGWEGVWGSGSAIRDYLIPIPVAGGAFHVPTFVLGALAVNALPTLSTMGASRLRALILGVALAGVLWLVNLQGLLRSWQTGDPMTSGLWQANPLGLFFVCDALLALLFTIATPQRPWLQMEVLSAVLLLLPSLIPVQMAMPRARTAEEKLLPFTMGASQRGQQRGDERLMVYTPLDTHASDFRQRAEMWVSKPGSVVHPRFHIDAEDVAVLFTPHRDAIQRFNADQAVATLCLYEDGAPAQWLPDADDCFSGHASFSERLQAATASRSPDEPPDVRWHLAARELCAKETLASVPEGQGLQITSAFICAGLTRDRDRLRLKYPDDARLSGQ